MPLAPPLFGLSATVAMGTAVKVHDLSKRYWLRQDSATLRLWHSSPRQELWALHQVNFEVPSGTLFGIIGDNGSGKTTLLKIIGGITPPTSGEVEIHGRVASLLELGVGFHPELTGIENIFLYGSILGLSSQEVRAQLDSIISFSGLDDFIFSPIKYYSTGMYARLGFAVAIHSHPELLLIDELLAVGDAWFQRRCLERIRELIAQGRTALLVTHDVDIAGYMCEEVLWLEQGKVRQQGAPLETVEAYKREVARRAKTRTAMLELATEKLQAHQQLPASAVTLRFTDAQGELREKHLTGQPLQLTIEFNFPEQLSNPSFLLQFFHKGKTLVGEIESWSQNIRPSTLEGQGTLHVRFSPLLFWEADYTLQLLIYDYLRPEHIYYFWEQEKALEVRTPWDIPHTDIMAHLPSRWELEPGEPDAQ